MKNNKSFSIATTLRVCYKLLADTAKDRIIRLEANSIPGNLVLLIAFHFSILDIIIRMAITLYINLLGYFINDYIDVEVDLANKDKDQSKALLIKEHKKTALALILCMSAVLIMATMFYSTHVCLSVVLLLLIVTIYTAKYKNKAFWDIIFIGLWGLALSSIAIPAFGWQEIQLILLLFLFGCSFETVQTIKDYEEDKKFGLTTTPIVIGVPKTLLTLRVIYIISTVYALFILREPFGILLLFPLLFKTSQDMSTYWTKLKISCGIVWLIIMVRLYAQYAV